MANDYLPPLFFTPVFKGKVWGGRNLRTILDKAISPEARIGESWELSGYPTDMSVAADGPYAGKPLADIISARGKEILGTAFGGTWFPLLYKFIDAQDKLSIQVHPDDAQARAAGWGAYGKTECWYIIHTEPDTKVIAGFNRPVTGPEIRERIASGTLVEVLNIMDIHDGDLIYVPAGTVHANQPGTFLYEVQQTSDTTLRLYDWSRNDPNRPLHIDESLSVLDMSHHDRHRIPAIERASDRGVSHRLRVACRYFAIEEYDFHSSCEVRLPRRGSFRVVTVIAGTLSLAHDQGTCKIMKGQTVLLPWTVTKAIAAAEEQTRFLVSWVPDLQKEIIDPLRAAGVGDDAIELLGGNPLRNDLLPLLRKG
jgi:mannose-6-phosphate isomerase